MNGFIHRIPFLRLFAALAAGVFAASQIAIPIMLTAVFALMGVGCIFTSFCFRSMARQFDHRWLFGLGALVLLFATGIGLAQGSAKETDFPTGGMTGIFLTEITGAPIEKAKSTLYKVNIISIYQNKNFTKVDKPALLYVAKDTTGKRFGIEDKLWVSTTFAASRSSGNPDSFDFARYLRQHGIAATGYAAASRYCLAEKNSRFSIKNAASHFRDKLLNIFREHHIEGDEFAVLAALMLGYNDALTRELMDSYSVTGAMHVLSVSGLHVAIICAVFYFMLGFMDKRRPLFVTKHLLVILFLWAFAFLTGLAPAVVRSALMFTLIATGHIVMRKPQIFNTIFFSAFIMLLYDPNYLFDVGFQLSYLAVLSIVYFEPKFKKFITVKNKPLRWLWEMTCVALAAQLGTSMLGIFYFHRFSNFFWLSNLVVVPLSGFIMYAAMALMVFSSVPGLSAIIAFILKWLLISMNTGVRFIEHLPMAAFPGWIDNWQLTLSMAALMLLAGYFAYRRYVLLMAGLACIVLFMTDETIRACQSSWHREAYILADSKSTHLLLRDGNSGLAISSDTLKMKELINTYIVRHHAGSIHILKDHAVSFAGKSFFVTNDSLLHRKHSDRTLKVDYLIVGNRTRITMKKLRSFIEPGTVIIDNTVSPWYSKAIRAECDSLHITCIDTKENGAWRIELE
jgi:competence protein ComEC